MERIRKRYSHAFKMKIMEEIRDGRWKSGSHAAKMYGIKDSLVYKWIDAMGFSHLKSKVMEIKTMEEIDELKLLRKQVKDLKLALAEETLSRQIEQATVQVAAGSIGISTEELKKKLAHYRAPDGFYCRNGGCVQWTPEAAAGARGLPQIRQIDGRLLQQREKTLA